MSTPRSRALIVEPLDFHIHHARGHEAERLRRGSREIDDAGGVARAAIVDPDLDATSVREIGDPHDRAHRQRAMRGRERIRIEELAARGALARGKTTVPRREPDLLEMTFGH